MASTPAATPVCRLVSQSHSARCRLCFGGGRACSPAALSAAASRCVSLRLAAAMRIGFAAASKMGIAASIDLVETGCSAPLDVAYPLPYILDRPCSFSL